MLGHENDVRAAGNTTVSGNPSAVTTHHFDDHDAMMRFGGRVQTVNRVGDDRNRRVESKSKIRAVDVIVDGFRDADNLKLMVAPEVARRRERAFAANDD